LLVAAEALDHHSMLAPDLIERPHLVFAVLIFALFAAGELHAERVCYASAQIGGMGGREEEGRILTCEQLLHPFE
jgi:hypothetical protein